MRKALIGKRGKGKSAANTCLDPIHKRRIKAAR